MSDSRSMTVDQKQAIAHQLAHGALFAQLIKVLIAKGVMSQEEANQALQNAAKSFVKPQATEMEELAAGVIVTIDDRL